MDNTADIDYFKDPLNGKTGEEAFRNRLPSILRSHETEINNLTEILESHETEINNLGTLVSNEQIMGVRFVDNGTDFVATRYGITRGAVQESTTVGNMTTVKCKVGSTYIDDMMIYKICKVKKGCYK